MTDKDHGEKCDEQRRQIPAIRGTIYNLPISFFFSLNDADILDLASVGITAR
jgi:hypothetical protein